MFVLIHDKWCRHPCPHHLSLWPRLYFIGDPVKIRNTVFEWSFYSAAIFLQEPPGAHNWQNQQRRPSGIFSSRHLSHLELMPQQRQEKAKNSKELHGWISLCEFLRLGCEQDWQQWTDVGEVQEMALGGKTKTQWGVFSPQDGWKQTQEEM